MVRNRTVVGDVEGSTEGFFSIGVTIDDLKEGGNLEEARERLIRLKIMG